ncbi:MAG: M14 family metallopeptidase [Candidatus Competibacteraceae bacterium]|nr:M14 family metallopeptidase [Candidatus Competibacteraceae bacterium]
MPKITDHLLLPASTPGTQRSLTVHRFGQPKARPKAYFQAALHADEWPGLLVVHHLLRLLEQADDKGGIRGEVVVVPVANPMGLSQYISGRLIGRFDFESGGNFNRNFPDLSGPAVEACRELLAGDLVADVGRLRKALVEAARQLPRQRELDSLKANLLELAVDGDYVFDLHCDGESLIHLYANHRHRRLAGELGAEIGAAVVILEDEPGGSPFDEACAGPWWKMEKPLGRKLPSACFAATVELRGQADVYDHYAAQDAANLFRFLQRRGIVEGEPGPMPQAIHLESPLDGVDVLTCPGAGILAYRKSLGDRVEEGEVVADLVDLLHENPHAARTPIPSATDGILFARMAEKLARPGQKICKVAGVERLAYREAGKLLED